MSSKTRFRRAPQIGRLPLRGSVSPGRGGWVGVGKGPRYGRQVFRNQCSRARCANTPRSLEYSLM